MKIVDACNPLLLTRYPVVPLLMAIYYNPFLCRLLAFLLSPWV